MAWYLTWTMALVVGFAFGWGIRSLFGDADEDEDDRLYFDDDWGDGI